MICCDCNTEVKGAHFNCKRCAACAAQRTHRPHHALTKKQIAGFHRWAGKMDSRALAAKLGAGRSSVVRYARDIGKSLAYHYKYKNNPEMVAEVCAYYAAHGKLATEAKYPHIRIRSLVERYPRPPRQVRWTEAQVKELARMAGIISRADQAAFFARPFAGAGSIKSVWAKKFKVAQRSINGLPWYVVGSLLRRMPPRIDTDFRIFGTGRYRIILWIDIDKYLKTDVPDYLRDAIKALAKFQRWLHGRNVRANILKMQNERRKNG